MAVLHARTCAGTCRTSRGGGGGGGVCVCMCVLQRSRWQAKHIGAGLRDGLHAGRPLPPLFDWLPGELDDCHPDIRAKLSGGHQVPQAMVS